MNGCARCSCRRFRLIRSTLQTILPSFLPILCNFPPYCTMFGRTNTFVFSCFEHCPLDQALFSRYSLMLVLAGESFIFQACLTRVGLFPIASIIRSGHWDRFFSSTYSPLSGVHTRSVNYFQHFNGLVHSAFYNIRMYRLLNCRHLDYLDFSEI